ncbi:MAG: bifunctional glutamate N-acetyltransferase/amino-acid acetyltransferase ArgJ [Thermodesulfobacteriota bacterium]
MTIHDLVCPGYQGASVAAGLKKNGLPDMGLIFSREPAAAAGVFTRNLVKAAPVLVSREHLSLGACRAIVANSGCANCCTGETGLSDARETAKALSGLLSISETDVCIGSTGVIGKRLDMDKVRNSLPKLVSGLSEKGLEGFSRAIMTTDRFPKTEVRKIRVQDKTVTVLGIAKGAGMIRPDVATMLTFILTDAKADAGTLSRVLKLASDRSFNCATVDGDTSTNDTVLLLANGVSGADVAGFPGEFELAVTDVCVGLAKKMVADGEGATKTVVLTVQGLPTDGQARAVADTIAHSQLVKTAMFGQDANWGRIVAAAGRSGVFMDERRLDLFFGQTLLFSDGEWQGPEAEAAASAVLKQDEIPMTLDLKSGPGRVVMFFSDLTIDYVKLNADYRS